MMQRPTIPGTEPAALTVAELRALYHSLVRARWTGLVLRPKPILRVVVPPEQPTAKLRPNRFKILFKCDACAKLQVRGSHARACEWCGRLRLRRLRRATEEEAA